MYQNGASLDLIKQDISRTIRGIEIVSRVKSHLQLLFTSFSTAVKLNFEFFLRYKSDSFTCMSPFCIIRPSFEAFKLTIAEETFPRRKLFLYLK